MFFWRVLGYASSEEESRYGARFNGRSRERNDAPTDKPKNFVTVYAY
jgi:hypothetical protein